MWRRRDDVEALVRDIRQTAQELAHEANRMEESHRRMDVIAKKMRGLVDLVERLDENDE